MGFFSRFRQRVLPTELVEGLLGYYGLGAWWLTTFTPHEREDIEGMWGWISLGQRPLTRGQVASNPLTPAEFLYVLSRRSASTSVERRILAKAREVNGGTLPGRSKGKSVAALMTQAKQLIQDGRLQQADSIVDKAFTLYEQESRIGPFLTEYTEVPPAPYWDFAVLYRKQKDYVREVGILERYVRQPRKPGGAPDRPDKYLERLEKARILLVNATRNDPHNSQHDRL